MVNPSPYNFFLKIGSKTLIPAPLHVPRDGVRRKEALVDAVDRVHRPRIGRRGRLARLHARHPHDEDRLAHVVEDENRVRQQKRRDGRPRLPREPHARHERLHRVVGEVADRPPLEGRQFGRGREGTRPHLRAQGRERVPVPVRDECLVGVDAEERIAPARLAARNALQQEHRVVLGDARKHRDRRLAVRQIFAVDGRARTRGRAPREFFFCQMLEHGLIAPLWIKLLSR